jgi:hypothetical protein
MVMTPKVKMKGKASIAIGEICTEFSRSCKSNEGPVKFTCYWTSSPVKKNSSLTGSSSQFVVESLNKNLLIQTMLGYHDLILSCLKSMHNISNEELVLSFDEYRM